MQLVQRLIELKVNFILHFENEILTLIEIEHFSYPCVNL
jgi:hypothetical protein